MLIEFILNYLTFSLKKIDAEGKVVYLIVDWGSDEPLSNYFHKEISNCQSIKFINISKEETKKYKLNFDVSLRHCQKHNLRKVAPGHFLTIFLNLG